MSVIRRTVKIIAVIVVGLLVLLLAVFGGLQTGIGQRLLASTLSSATTGPDFGLEIEGIDGFVPVRMQVDSIRISDGDGVWLTLEGLRLAWEPLGLFSGEVRISAVEADRLSVLRLPASSAEVPANEEPAEPLELPSLPVSVDLAHLRIGEINLAPSVIGTPVTATLIASGHLGELGENLVLSVDLSRTDGVAARALLDARYVPETGRLTVDATVEEPPGGIAAAMLARPDLPEVHLTLAGDGTLDDWQGELTAAAGEIADLSATARIAATPDGHRIAADMAGDIATFLPPTLQPLVGEAPTVSLEATLLPDGAIAVDRLDVAVAAMQAGLTGRVDTAAEQGTATLRLELAPSSSAITALAGPVGWDHATVELTAAGTFEEPDLDLTISAGGIAYQTYGAASVDAQVAVRPAGPLSGEDATADVSVTARLTGLEGLPPQALALIGEALDLQAQGRIGLDGSLEDLAAALSTEHVDLTLAGAGRDWGADGSGQVALSLADLSPLADALGQPVAGSVDLTAQGRWGEDGLGADISAHIDDAHTGIAQVDALLEDGAVLEARFAADGDGRIAEAELNLAAGPVTVTARPDLNADPQAVDWQVSVTDLAALTPLASGGAELSGRVDDPMGQPAVAFTLSLDEGTAAGRAIGDAEVSGTVRLGDDGGIDGDVNLAATLDGVPVTLQAAAGMAADGAVSAHDLSADLGGLAVTGDADMAADGRITAQLGLNGRVDALAGALGVPLSGAVDLTADAELDGAALDVSATGSISGIATPDAQIGFASVSAAVTGTPDAPVLDVTLNGTNLVTQAITASTFRATAAGGLDGLAVTAAMAGPEVTADAAATISLGEAITADLSRLNLTYRDVNATLVQGGRITIAGSDVAIDRLTLAADGGSVSVAGQAGAALALDLTLSDLPLALARLADPDLDLTGLASGTITVRGTAAQPDIAYNLAVAGGGLADVRTGLPTADVSASGRLAGNTLQIQAAIQPSSGGTLDISGSADLAGGPLDLAVTGAMDLGSVPALAARFDRIGGQVALDLAVGGTLNDPQASGQVTLTNGIYEDNELGVQLSQITMAAEGNQSQLRITQLSALTPGGGSLTGSGEITLDFDAGLPVNVSIRGSEATVVNSDDLTVDINTDLTISGTAMQALQVAGTIGVNRMEISIPEHLPANLPVLEVEELNPPAHVAERLEEEAAQRAAQAAAGPASPLAIALNIAVNAPRAVFVRGRGLTAEVGGALSIGGTVDRPLVGGQLSLRRGHLDALGRRFELDAGTVQFVDVATLDPLLDFQASAAIEDGRGIINISGYASDPQISFSSEPTLPEDEVMSRILFGRSVSELSAFQALTLAQAVAELTGGQSPDLLDGLREATGLSEVEVNASDDVNDASLGLGSYIGDNIYLGVEQGLANPTDTTGRVEVEITPNISLESEVGSDGSGRIGVTMEWDY
ncbi:MAG: translocation/assembly module TamB domain-containing protein [Rhodospirillaceae bacterium]|nr:translocation/assembly module TamB domain-containing protein [Rhodospirillaceae bacterium]